MFIIEPNGNFPYTFNDQRVQQLEICQCLQETSSGGHPGKNRENMGMDRVKHSQNSWNIFGWTNIQAILLLTRVPGLDS